MIWFLKKYNGFNCAPEPLYLKGESRILTVFDFQKLLRTVKNTVKSDGMSIDFIG